MTDKLRMSNPKKTCGISSRLWIPVLIISLLQALSCGRYKAENERKRTECFAEILTRVDRNWIGEDRFFEENLLASPYPEVRQWCALALARIGSHRALPLLLRAARTEDAAVRAASAFAIGAIGDRDLLGNQYSDRDIGATRALIGLLDDSSISVRMRAAEALGKTGSHNEVIEIVHRLERFSNHGSPAERSYVGYAITALARLKDSAAFPILERLAGSNDPEVRWRALDALARLQDGKASRLFIENLESSNPAVLSSAIRGASNLDTGAAGHILRFLPPRDNKTGKLNPGEVRCSAIQAVGELKNKAAIPYIRAALDAVPIDEAHPDQMNFAILAAGTLGEIGSNEAEPVLIPMLNSTQPVANSAAIALAKVLRGNPGRFFTVVERSRFSTPDGLPAWSESMAELGNSDAVAELNRLIAQALDHSGEASSLLPIFVRSLVKANPPELQETVAALIKLRDPAVLPIALAAYRPDGNVKEPWAPIVEAFNTCCPGAYTGAKAGILLSLAPWTGDPKIQQVLWGALKASDRGVRLASLALLRKSGISGSVEDPGPSATSLTRVTSIALAASRKNSTVAAVKTTRGTFEIELLREDAPLTVADFTSMARRGDLEGYVFGEVNPFQRVGAKDSEPSRAFARQTNREINMRPFERGSVGTAPGNGAARFFISLVPQPYLDGVNTCFGRIISGIQVVDRITQGDRIVHVDIKETVSFLDYVRY